MTDTEILEKAAELIEQGWAQGDYKVETETGISYCMLGAMTEAAGFDLWDRLSLTILFRLANLIDPNTCGPAIAIAEFNDSSRTSKEDVLLVFKKAIYEHES